MKKITITLEHDAGLWFATSDELNCFIVHRTIEEIFNDFPNVIRMVEEREKTIHVGVAK